MAHKVIVADDEPIMRKAMQSLINWKELGCELVYVADNGQEVIDWLEVLKPDILILDIRMPGKSGIDVVRYLWENKLGIKVILLTAYADFSYAQSAIKYDVIDYVIKTGAFEGLVAAVEKAKAKIRQEEQQTDDGAAVLKENFLKSVFDGSLYEPEELEETALKLGLCLEKGYFVMLIHFRTDEDGVGDKKQRNYKSMLNFLHMAFGEQMMQGLAVKKDMLAAVLHQESLSFREPIEKKCLEVIDMMENFMGMYVYIGISRRQDTVLSLKNEFNRANDAVNQSLYVEQSKIAFYDEMGRSSVGLLEEDVKLYPAVSRKKTLIVDCERYIEENYAKCISVADVAKSIGASPSYLSRIYKEDIGSTIIYTINQKKLEKAREYLMNTDMKIYEIADALGFENTTYFSHLFKKHMGISPKDCK